MEPNQHPNSRPLGATQIPDHIQSPLPPVLPAKQNGGAISGFLKLFAGGGGLIFFVIVGILRASDDSAGYMVESRPTGTPAVEREEISEDESTYINQTNDLIDRDNAAMDRLWDLIDDASYDYSLTFDPIWTSDLRAQVAELDSVLSEAKTISPPSRFGLYHLHLEGVFSFSSQAGAEISAFLLDGDVEHIDKSSELAQKAIDEDAAAAAIWNDIVNDKTPTVGDSAVAQPTATATAQSEIAIEFPLALSFVDSNSNPVGGACVGIFADTGSVWSSICDNDVNDLDTALGNIETTIPFVGGYVREYQGPDNCQPISSNVSLRWAQGVGWEQLVHDC